MTDDQVTIFWLVVCFGFLVTAGIRPGADPHAVLLGLFAAHGVRDWPTGVQESDAPRFAVAHLDSLRPTGSTPTDGPRGETTDDRDDWAPELIDLGSRRFDPRPR
jgi:hypothetical protein